MPEVIQKRCEMEMVQDLDPLALPKYSGIDCSRGKQVLVCTTNRPGPDAWTALLKALTDDSPLNTCHTYLFIDMHHQHNPTIAKTDVQRIHQQNMNVTPVSNISSLMELLD